MERRSDRLSYAKKLSKNWQKEKVSAQKLKKRKKGSQHQPLVESRIEKASELGLNTNMISQALTKTSDFVLAVRIAIALEHDRRLLPFIQAEGMDRVMYALVKCGVDVDAALRYQLKDCCVCYCPFIPAEQEVGMDCGHTCDECLTHWLNSPKMGALSQVALEEGYNVDDLAPDGRQTNCPVCRGDAPTPVLTAARSRLPVVRDESSESEHATSALFFDLITFE